MRNPNWKFTLKGILFAVLFACSSTNTIAQGKGPGMGPLPKAIIVDHDALNNLLYRVKAQANLWNVSGWPELDSGSSPPTEFDLKDPLLNRIWLQTNRVIWHYQPKTNHWDVLISLQGEYSRGFLVFIENAFGTPVFHRITELPYGISIWPHSREKGHIPKGFPKWVSTGPIWYFSQESDGESGPLNGIFHSKAGIGWEVDLPETKEEHDDLSRLDRTEIEKLKAKGVDPDKEPYAFQAHSCSPFFVEDLTRAKDVRSGNGLVWFHLASLMQLQDFVITSEAWNNLRKQVKAIPKPIPISRSRGSLTLRSTRTPPALSSALSQLPSSSASFSASVQAGRG